MLFSLVYVSSATRLLTHADLEDLLVTSRDKNARLGVTGALLYRDGNVMQLLEGDEATVRALYATIGDDSRHHNLMTVLEGPEDTRQFPDWSMAFRDLAVDQGSAVPGYSTFLSTPLSEDDFGAEPTLGQQLLISFKQNLGGA